MIAKYPDADKAPHTVPAQEEQPPVCLPAELHFVNDPEADLAGRGDHLHLVLKGGIDLGHVDRRALAECERVIEFDPDHRATAR